MDDKNLECVDDLEDFEFEPCEYRVLAYGFGLNGEDLQNHKILYAHTDPKEAINVAEQKVKELDACIKSGGIEQLLEVSQPLSLVVVSVETVIKLDNEEQYAGTLFTEGILV